MIGMFGEHPLKDILLFLFLFCGTFFIRISWYVLFCEVVLMIPSTRNGC